MGWNSFGLLFFIITISLSSAYHRYHHYRPRDVYDEYSYSDGRDHDSGEDETDASEVDEPNFQEELNAADPAYDIPNYEIPNINEIPVDRRANPLAIGYEVTEHVVDIPNPAEVRPIIAIYSTPRPLNFARLNNTHYNRVNKKHNQKRIVPNYNTRDNFNTYGYIIPTIKETVEDVKTSFKNDLNGLKNQIIKTVGEPVSFLSKLHKKANEVINNVNRWFDSNHDGGDFETF